ncbi:unnamed protein product [Ixodes pacificus]
MGMAHAASLSARSLPRKRASVSAPAWCELIKVTALCMRRHRQVGQPQWASSVSAGV